MADTTEPVDTIEQKQAPETREAQRKRREAYWRANIRIIIGLLLIWATVSLGFSILLARPLSTIQIGSVPLSFWFAQQGSIITFVILIFFYAWRMNKLDREFDVEE